MNYLLRSILKKFVAVGIISAVAIGIAACGVNSSSDNKSSASSDGQPKEIRIGYWASPNAELLIKESGELEKEYPNVKVTWTEFTSGADILTAMQAGSIDFSTIGTPPGTTGIVNNYPFSVYYLEDIIGESEGLIVRNDSGINSLEDLKGKTIATSFSTTSHFSFMKSLEYAAVNSSDINILDMDASNIYAAWERGDIDGAYIWEPVKTQLLEADGKEIISSKEVADKGALTGEFAIVHNDFYEKYPEVVKSYIDLLDKNARVFNDNPEKAASTMSKGLGLTERETLKAMSGMTEVTKEEQSEYLGTSSSTGSLASILKDTANFLYEQGKLTQKVDEKTFQDSFLTELYDN